jgi:hypothetical protein
MIASSRILQLAVVLAVFLATLTPTISQGLLDIIPKPQLELIPEACRQGADDVFPVAIACAVDNLISCFGLLGVLDDFEEFPPVENITSCDDIEMPFCGIASTCDPCFEEFGAVVDCMITNDPGADANVTELVDTCVLEC